MKTTIELIPAFEAYMKRKGRGSPWAGRQKSRPAQGRLSGGSAQALTRSRDSGRDVERLCKPTKC
jgi:hypothetical protein